MDRIKTSTINLATLPWWGRLLRRVLLPSFWVFNKLSLKVHISGMENFTNNPGTLLVANHKSDFDTVVLIPSIYYGKCGRGVVRKTRFVAAEQMFEPGYVSMYLLKSKWNILRKFLYPANMSALLKGGGAHPIPGSRNRKFNRHLRVVRQRRGNLKLNEVLDDPPETVFANVKKDARISDILRWRYHQVLDSPCQVSKFKPKVAGDLRKAHIEELEYSLDYFAYQLNSGGCIYIAPEGEISKKGNFKGIRAGLGRLIKASENEITLLPINFTYDFLTSGRPSVFMNVGEQLVDSKNWQQRDIEKEMSKRIAALSTITLPQLVAKQGESDFEQGDYVTNKNSLKRAVFDSAIKLKQKGVIVDENLLEKKEQKKCFARFIKYCTKNNLAFVEGDRITFSHKTPPPSPNSNDNKFWWRYALNEYHTAAVDVSADTVFPCHPRESGGLYGV